MKINMIMTGSMIIGVILANEHRFVLTEYAINECVGIHTILSLLRDDRMKKKTFEMVQLHYVKM